MTARPAAKRQRRSREQARAEILAAVESALAEMPFNDLTVDLLMTRTGMTRSSFYHYFSSLEEIALALLEDFEADVVNAVEPWLSEGETGDDPKAATVDNLTRLFVMCLNYGKSMSAVEQAAGRSQLVYRNWRARILDDFIAKTAGFIRRQKALGLSSAADPERLASALILMNHAVLLEHMDREQPDSPEALGRTVAEIWNAAIFDRA